MGDPECQTILPLLKSDLLELILSCCEENLENQIYRVERKKSICVVCTLCSKGYPDNIKKMLKFQI